jgi:hypothetical protein
MTTIGNDIKSTNINKINQNRPNSAKLRSKGHSSERTSKVKEKLNTLHPWEYDEWFNQQDLTGCTNKSALIYRLMRSRLEANLAKSITTNRDQTNNKKKLSTSSTT